MEKIYLHSISSRCDINIDKEKLSRVLSCGYLLSRRLRNLDISFGFNGLDYISLCDYEKRYLPSLDGRYEYNSYHIYIENGLSLIFDNNIAIIKPILLYSHDRNLVDIMEIPKLGLLKERYTDLPDEVQVKDRISFEHLKAITFSIEIFRKDHTDKEYLEYLKMLKDLLKKYHYNIPVINLDNIKIIKK